MGENLYMIVSVYVVYKKLYWLLCIVQAIQSPDHVRQKFVKNLQRKVNAAITDKSQFPGFRSPTSWSTLLRRHSVACWSVITTTGARASCG